MKTIWLILLICLSILFDSKANIAISKTHDKPLRVGVVGLVHAHVGWILGREDHGDIEIVGIVEPNRALALRESRYHGFSMDIVFDTIEEMVTQTQPEAVTAFNTIYDHLSTVEYCAPRGIHVMVEKPLAVSLDHAEKMIELARKHDIHLLTNYETTWYQSNSTAYDLVHEQRSIGDIRKIIFHTGHPGPIEIGCNEEFLEWLTDPVLNGGGAMTDFGCYGANLATWLMKGEPPLSVMAITQQLKPELYPKVDDEASILITYPGAQVIIQASWNWSFHRKDMEVHGQTGYIVCKNREDMLLMEDMSKPPTELKAASMPLESSDPFAFLAKVVREDIKLPPFDLSSIENNLMAMQILEAAKLSASEGKTVIWKDHFGQ